MRVLLVTSEITYVPDNYSSLFEELFKRVPNEIAGLVVLENLSLSIYKDILGLYLLGCKKIAKTLIRNVLSLKHKKREKIFEQHHLPVFRAKSMNDSKMIKWVKDHQIDLIVNLRTRCIYKNEILNAPRLGCVNIHHGILPQYRGTLCDLYALYEKRSAGFTIHQMNEKIDAGRILAVQTVSQGAEKDYIKYLEKTGIEEAQTLSEIILETARSGNLPEGIPNQCSNPLYTKNPTRQTIRRIKEAGIQL